MASNPLVLQVTEGSQRATYSIAIFKLWSDPVFADYMSQMYKAGGLYTGEMTVPFKVFMTVISLVFTAVFADDFILRIRERKAPAVT